VDAVQPENTGGRRLRILFVFDRAGVIRQYASAVAELVGRGHEVTVGLQTSTGDVPDAIAGLPGARLEAAPERSTSGGWPPIVWLVRALGDLARYSDPRYEHAPVLRARMSQKVVGRLAKPGTTEPIARGLALGVARRLASRTDAVLSARVIRAVGRLEAAIPTSPSVDHYLDSGRFDAVLVTAAVKLASSQVEFLKSARLLGIPAASCVASWDNLTNKGLLKVVPERVIVWNARQRDEAVELHGVPRERVVATGAQLFDQWFERRPTTPREAFVRHVGLDPAQPYVLFVGSSPFVTNHSDDEVALVVRWIEALRASDDERLRRIGVVVRPHPVGKGWRDADLSRFANVAIWPRRSERPINPDDQADFFDSLAHSAAVVGINTTAMIEAAVVGKSVLTVLAPEFAQESTLHFHYLLEENGGFLHVASSMDEHARQLSRILDEGTADAERRRAFVESFVRPHGLDVPATPIFADAVEDLAALEVDRPRQLWVPPLRLLLAIEAGLTSATIGVSGARRRLQRLRHRVGAKARRHGLLPSPPAS
jgi:hypothetical protein